MSSFGVKVWCAVVLVVIVGELPMSTDAQASGLDPSFYKNTCPNVHSIVREVIRNVSKTDPRMLGSLIRLHFHDCFVQGCDASILLNDTKTIASEQSAPPNSNSIRGLDVVNKIKTEVEKACPGVVSCADILALAAEISSVLGQGPDWKVPLGRRDSTTANKTLAGLNLPDKASINSAQPDPNLNTTYLQQLRSICPKNGPGNALTNLDSSTPDKFDKNYYSNLQIRKGLLQSDQELFSTPGAETVSIVNKFSSDENAFFEAFKASMIKMGNIGVITGNKGEIRKQCNFVNTQSIELGLGLYNSEDGMGSIFFMENGDGDPYNKGGGDEDRGPCPIETV
ncbi:hypothetical protein Ahy_B04g069825 [Arachis hypogaea]|uniref:Peroxidase n=1 Tax=Arachis hypogaea TaxID=3818 RepID=A0A444ZDN9_ARAHY|nr:hypothetical protein Ahy_B04g069825 [Arachis hypogaea]